MANANPKNLPILLLVAGIFCLATGGGILAQCNNEECTDYVSSCDPFGPSTSCFEETHCDDAPCDFQIGAYYGTCAIGADGRHCDDQLSINITYCTHYGHELGFFTGQCDDCIHALVCETTEEVPLKEFSCSSSTYCP